MWTNIQTAVDGVSNIGLKLIPLIAVVAFLVFILAVGRFIRSTGDEAELKKTKKILIWGVIGLFILFTIWAIIAFLQIEFFGSAKVGIPQIRFGEGTRTQTDTRVIEYFNP